MQALDELFSAIRKAVPSGQWSVGVGLARDGCVVGESFEDDEITLRVMVGSRRRSFEVTLWPEDEEWQCDCPDGNDVCGHVAAGIIALRQAQKEGKELPESRVQLGRLGYRLGRYGDKLEILRVKIQGETEVPWLTTIQTEKTHERGAPLVTSQGDLQTERALGTWRSGAIPRNDMTAVLEALKRCDDVTLEGVPVKVSALPVVPHGVVEDLGDGFRLRLVPDPDVTEMFANGAVICADVLRPIGQGSLSERELSELPTGRYYPPHEVSHLVTDVLPSLRRRVPVTVDTKRLPEGGGDPPRLIVAVSEVDDALTVFPTLVYGDPPSARVDGGRLVVLGEGRLPFRDERAEKHLIARLARQLELQPGRKKSFAGEHAVAFAAKLERFTAGDVEGDAHEDYYIAAPLTAELTLDDEGRFSVSFDSDGDAANAQRVVKAWQRGLNLARLDGGGWAPLPRNWLKRYGKHVAQLLAARDSDGGLPSSSFGDVVRLCEALERPAPPRFEQLRTLLQDFEGIPEAALPSDLLATLRTYQRAGVDWLTFLRGAGLGGMLADDMGLGKTLQALCAVSGRTLIVAPTSVLHNWAKEAQRFRPSLSVSTYHGPKRKLDAAADLTLTTYAILRLDTDKLASVSWGSVVLDEAQTIKNPDSKVARAAFRLKADFRLTLTGTPVENRLDDLWSQLHFSNPGVLGGRQHFSETYVKPIAEGDETAAAMLRERVRPFILRRLKRDVAPELPPRTDVVVRCILDERERAVYDAISAATRREVVAALAAGGNVIAALEALLRLRQASCHSALVPGQEADGSTKVALLLELLTEAVAEEHKALVFSQWTSMLDLVEPHLSAAGISFNRLDGSTRDRQGTVAAFQDPEGPAVMLLSLKAGGTGLNLTAADHVFLLDPWWNPAVEDQAADRAHRIGQERPVLVHRLVAADTVEERILGLQDRKRALAEAAIGEAGGARAISRDELLALLGG